VSTSQGLLRKFPGGTIQYLWKLSVEHRQYAGRKKVILQEKKERKKTSQSRIYQQARIDHELSFRSCLLQTLNIVLVFKLFRKFFNKHSKRPMNYHLLEHPSMQEEAMKKKTGD
jgi:tRNA/tmRNA/rRNA uracil-C5-methylase (TrmA/RlmC/RlmD family)